MDLFLIKRSHQITLSSHASAHFSTSEGFPFLLDEKTLQVSVKICIAYLQEGQVLLENNQYVRLRTFTVCLITQNPNPWLKEMVSI